MQKAMKSQEGGEAHRESMMSVSSNRKSSVALQLEEITAGFDLEPMTVRTAFVARLLLPISTFLVVYGIYELADKEVIVDQAIAFLLNMALPLAFMFASDICFLELVATNILIQLAGKLCIFNGFMDQDEDFHVLLRFLGLRSMTGRGEAGGINNLRKSITQPLQSSKERMSKVRRKSTLVPRKSTLFPGKRGTVGLPTLPNGRASVFAQSDANTLARSPTPDSDQTSTRTKEILPSVLDTIPRRSSTSASTDSLRRQRSRRDSGLFTDELKLEFEARENEISNLNGCNGILLQLCDSGLSSEERGELIKALNEFESALDCNFHVHDDNDKCDDVLHQL
jgi:hypothetical protein